MKTDHHVNAPDIIEMVLAAARPMSRPAFRGQANADWQLRSGAVHRIAGAYGDSVLDDNSSLRQLVDTYHREISAAMETIDGDHMMSSLQRLSILQHWGAATGFLDFTESALVAPCGSHATAHPIGTERCSSLTSATPRSRWTVGA